MHALEKSGAGEKGRQMRQIGTCEPEGRRVPAGILPNGKMPRSDSLLYIKDMYKAPKERNKAPQKWSCGGLLYSFSVSMHRISMGRKQEPFLILDNIF
jgi:hypothetical protein